MKVIAINENEYTALRMTLPHHKAIYLYLRWEMDYSTGVTTTTYSQIITSMTPPERKGQNKVVFSKDQIKNSLDSLVRVGLIQKNINKDFLSFCLPLAQTKEVIVTTNGYPMVTPMVTPMVAPMVTPPIEANIIKESCDCHGEKDMVTPMVAPMVTRCLPPLKVIEEEEVREEQIKDENIYAETVEAKTPKPKKTKTPAPTVEKPEDITQEAWHILLTHRKNKKASMIPKIIERVVGKFRAASVATGKTIDEIIYFYVEKNWTGFEVDWMVASTTTQTPTRKNKDVKPDYAAMFADLPGDDSSPNIVFGPDANTRPIKDITPFPFLN